MLFSLADHSVGWLSLITGELGLLRIKHDLTNNSEMLKIIEAAKFRKDRLSINSTGKLELKRKP